MIHRPELSREILDEVGLRVVVVCPNLCAYVFGFKMNQRVLLLSPTVLCLLILYHV